MIHEVVDSNHASLVHRILEQLIGVVCVHSLRDFNLRILEIELVSLEDGVRHDRVLLLIHIVQITLSVLDV